MNSLLHREPTCGRLDACPTAPRCAVRSASYVDRSQPRQSDSAVHSPMPAECVCRTQRQADHGTGHNSRSTALICVNPAELRGRAESLPLAGTASTHRARPLTVAACHASIGPVQISPVMLRKWKCRRAARRTAAEVGSRFSPPWPADVRTHRAARPQNVKRSFRSTLCVPSRSVYQPTVDVDLSRHLACATPTKGEHAPPSADHVARRQR